MVKLIRMNNATKSYPTDSAEALPRYVSAAVLVWDAPLGPIMRVYQDASEPLPLTPPLTV